MAMTIRWLMTSCWTIRRRRWKESLPPTKLKKMPQNKRKTSPWKIKKIRWRMICSKMPGQNNK